MDLREEVPQMPIRAEVRKYPLMSMHNLYAVFFFLLFAFVFGYLIVDNFILFAFKFGDAAAYVMLIACLVVFLYVMYRIHKRRRTIYSNIPSKHAAVTSISQVFDPVNMVLILGNIFVFVLVQTLFFWFVASRNTVDSAKDLTKLAVNITKETGKINGCQYTPYSENLLYQTLELNYTPRVDTQFGYSLIEYDKSAEFQKQLTDAKTLKSKRNSRNIKPTLKYIGSFLLVILCLIILNVLRAKRMGRTFGKIEGVLFLATIAAFATEVSFYLLVVRSVQYVGEFEAITELRFPYETRDYGGIVDPYIKSNEWCF